MHKEHTIICLIWFITQEFNTWKSNFEKKSVDQKVLFVKISGHIENQKQASVFSASVKTVGQTGFDVAT